MPQGSKCSRQAKAQRASDNPVFGSVTINWVEDLFEDHLDPDYQIPEANDNNDSENQLLQANYVFAIVEYVQEEASGDKWESDLLEENSDIEEKRSYMDAYE